ncbi:hypothetical protein KBC75_01765 [Candidatus Shapirobacteria bacterium]|nr:hypothetical protein [Candidatus Shapirobacteria bacterium]
MDKLPVRITNDEMTQRMGEFGNSDAFMFSLMAKFANEKDGQYPHAFNMVFAQRAPELREGTVTGSETQNFVIVATVPNQKEAVIMSRKGILLVNKVVSDDYFYKHLAVNVDWLMENANWKNDIPANKMLYGVGLGDCRAINPNKLEGPIYDKASEVIKMSEEYWKK